jgi:hypothetical protein
MHSSFPCRRITSTQHLAGGLRQHLKRMLVRRIIGVRSYARLLQVRGEHQQQAGRVTESPFIILF